MSASATQLRSLGEPAQDLHADSSLCSCDLVMDSEGQAYNEEAFRYFLDIERKRAEVSNQALLLLLVDLKPEAGTEESISPSQASKMFSGLAATLRETDFLGWYREERVAGAVLIQRADAPRAEVSHELTRRVAANLSRQFPQPVARRLQVRVFQLPSRSEDKHDQE